MTDHSTIIKDKQKTDKLLAKIVKIKKEITRQLKISGVSFTVLFIIWIGLMIAGIFNIFLSILVGFALGFTIGFFILRKEIIKEEQEVIALDQKAMNNLNLSTQLQADRISSRF